MNFFEILYAQKNGAALPANFFDPLFAKSFTPVTEWGEYDGTLPAQYSANGSALADYRVYGANGGVGDRTVNLFDKNATDGNNGYVNNKYLTSNGYENISNSYYISEYMPITGGNNYALCHAAPLSNAAAICFYTSEKVYISGVSYASQETVAVTAPANAAYARATVYKTQTNVMLVEGSTAPAEYVPYGYEVDMETEAQNLWTGTLEQGNIGVDGTESTNNTRLRSSFVECFPNNDYYLEFDGLATGYGVRFYNANKKYITYTKTWLNSGTKFSTPDNCRYIRYIFKYDDSTVIYPTDVYEIKMTNNTPYSNTTTPIYIGDTPLGEDEYVSFKEQKVYRYVDGVLTPTDPPVPLPALPTVDGTNIVDYAGQSAAPSRFYAKYQRK